ncbi:Crp/Fnr family transcriptional regulator [Billgrantia pellis]|uniref:Crp/Fnr family transcriptional regulator n=1 Tax=Billgrantia pellis TaxID=2606936 RepID=A0A7V7FXS0_9GAMM|nr:Crp/Fnr family transcriptional regulator [Halomonas pellis]KAA0010872.1 Crp/Fnr family transcriptional regulator [Halomonas pellis]
MTLLKNPVFQQFRKNGALTAEEEKRLLGLEQKPRRVDASDPLWHENDTVDAFCILKQGWAYSFRNLDSGAKQILKLYLPGDIIGMRDFGFSHRLAGVEMIDEGVVCPFSHQQLFEVMDYSATLASGIVAIAVRQQAMLTERLVYVGRHTAQQRLAHFLYELYLRLSRIEAVKDNTFSLPLSQEQVGDALGLSSVHVSRTFSMLRDEGLVLRDRQRIQLPDPMALASMAEFSDAYLDESMPSPFLDLHGISSRALRDAQKA